MTPQDRAIRTWLRRNRGIQSQLAVSYHCSQQFVQQIVYGHSTAKEGLLLDIERELRQAGWPGGKGK